MTTPISAAALTIPAGGEAPRAALALSTHHQAVTLMPTGETIDHATARLLTEGWTLARALDDPPPALPPSWGVALDIEHAADPMTAPVSLAITHPNGATLAEVRLAATPHLWIPIVLARQTVELYLGPLAVETWADPGADPAELILAALAAGELLSASAVPEFTNTPDTAPGVRPEPTP